MRVPRVLLATVASAAVALLCGCSASDTLVDRGADQSLYLLADGPENYLYEYGPGDRQPRSARLVSETADPWMDAAGDLYLRRSTEGIFRYDASSWKRERVFRGDDDSYAVDTKGTLYVAIMKALATVAPDGRRTRRVRTAPSAAWQMVAVDARGRVYIATMSDGHIRVYDDIARPPSRVIAAPRGLRTLALDGRGRLVGLGDTGDELYEYANAMARPVVVTRGLTNAVRIAFDTKGDIYVLNAASTDEAGATGGPGSVVEYAFGVPYATREIPFDDPISMAVDHAGDLYVSFAQADGSDALYVYAPEGTEPIRRYDAVAGTLFFGTPTRPGRAQATETVRRRWRFYRATGENDQR